MADETRFLRSSRFAAGSSSGPSASTAPRKPLHSADAAAVKLLETLFDKGDFTTLDKEIRKTGSNAGRRGEHATVILSAFFDHIKHVKPFPDAVLLTMIDRPDFKPCRNEVLDFLIKTRQDYDLIHSLLKKDVTFSKIKEIPADDAVLRLLKGARRKKSLFAGKTSPDSALDVLLKNLDLRGARQYLDSHGYESKEIAVNWGKAVANAHHDVLRALLILCDMDGHTTYRSEEKMRIKDPQINEVVKGIPYTSIKRRNINLNGEASFEAAQEQIWCRHIATDALVKMVKTGSPDFIVPQYADKNALAKNIDHANEEKFQAIHNPARNQHFVGVHGFGEFLAAQFHEIQYSQKKKRFFMVCTDEHVMWMVLKEKQRQRKKSFVVQFGDPNLTATWARSRHSLPVSFKLDRFTDYLKAPSYLVNNLLGALAIRPFGAGPPQPSQDTKDFGSRRFLSVSLRPEDYTPSLVVSFFTGGHAADACHANLETYLQTLGQADIDMIGESMTSSAGIFVAPLAKGNRGLYRALLGLLAYLSPHHACGILKPAGDDVDFALRRLVAADALQTVRRFATLL
ncbi:MAG: ShET2/EspL2 family type III secretion system effector toxin, partial [Janthinobacterium lividum]